jgi:hypothetical protein
MGSDAGGFRVSVTSQGAMRIEAWGYWSEGVIASFTREAPAAAQRLMPGATFTLDAKELKPQGAGGQEALRVFFRALAGVTFARGIVNADNALTKMQLTRLLRECALDGRFTYETSGG